MNQSTNIKKSLDNKIFDIVVTVLLVLIGAVSLYPLLFVVVASVSDPTRVNSGDVWLYPIGFQLGGYIEVFKNEWIMVGYRNSVIYTVLGSLLNVLVTLMAGYVMARKDLFGRKFLNWYIAIPMWIGGGLIPTYLVVNSLHLVNSPVVLLILGLVSSYNIIITRTFIQTTVPYELQEAAKIDGCSDFGIFWKIVAPLSKPIIAVIGLYCIVGHWNDYFSAMIYLNNRNYYPLQVFLREILILNQDVDTTTILNAETLAYKLQMAQVMRYSLIIIASVPLLIIYPFVQKFFVKGVMIGSVKG